MSKIDSKRVLRGVGTGIAVIVLSFALVSYHQNNHASGAPNGRVFYGGSDTNSNGQIFSINADGTDAQQLTSSGDSQYYFDATVSPDGRKVAFVGDPYADGNTQIYTMNNDGTDQVDITHDDTTYNDQPEWSADGTKLLFVRQPANNSSPQEIYTMNNDGTNITQVTHDSSAVGVGSWNPNGTSIIYVCYPASYSELCTINSDGTNQAQLTSDNNYHDSPSYSPDGSEIAFTRSNNPYDQTVKIMNSNGTNIRSITTSGVDNYNVSWSPDGTKLIYDSDGGTGGTERVFYINSGGTGETGVTTDGTQAGHASWGPVVTDSDGDGIDDTIEAAAPNNGDANNDGIPDRDQANVTDYVNPVTNQYVVLQSNCSATTSLSAAVAPSLYKDAAFNYPEGLLNFTLRCTPGTTATVTQYYYGLQNTGTLVLRKFNSSNHSYETVPGATISSATIGNKTLTEITYQIQDGGPLDQDGSANGVIVDPVGVALPSVGTPDTGLGGTTPFSKSSLAPLL